MWIWMILNAASLLAAPAQAHTAADELQSLCAVLLNPHSTGRDETEALRGWFKADLEIVSMSFLPAGPRAFLRDRETVVRARIAHHTPILGVHGSHEKRAQAVALQGEIEIHLDRWDCSEMELPIVGLKLQSAPIQIMDWIDGRRYFRFDRTFVQTHLMPRLAPIAWDRWTRDNRLQFARAKMGQRERSLPPGYRLVTSTLLDIWVGDATVATHAAAAHAFAQVRERYPHFDPDYHDVQAKWLTDIAGRVLAIYLRPHADFEFYYDASGQPL